MDTQAFVYSLPRYDIPDLKNYSLEQWEKDVKSIQPRAFDKYVLPFFMAVFALKSGNKKMSKWPRRLLFSSAIYMFYKNYTIYKESLDKLRSQFNASKSTAI